MMDVERYNTHLHTTIVDEYYSVYPYLCAAVKNFVKDHVDSGVENKDFYLSLTEVQISSKVRELSTHKI